MTSTTDLLESIVERFKLGMLELGVIETKEVVHDDIAGQCGKGVSQVQGFFSCFKLLHADREGVDVAVNDVNEVQDGASREPDQGQPDLDT